jgi:exosortase H (IPTLxxWG-CTERM-specific)
LTSARIGLKICRYYSIKGPQGIGKSYYRNLMKRFISLFIIILLISFGFIYLPAVREHIIGPFTQGITYLSGWLIQVFGGEVVIQGNTLSIPGFAVQVLDMCNGVEATIFLWAAILAFPASFTYKLKGLFIGTLTIHTLNIIRIISLLYLGFYKPEWFHWVHWYVWDGLIMLDILIVFLAWIRLMPISRQERSSGEAVAV